MRALQGFLLFVIFVMRARSDRVAAAAAVVA